MNGDRERGWMGSLLAMVSWWSRFVPDEQHNEPLRGHKSRTAYAKKVPYVKQD